jgi:hypothetical protein
MQVERIGTATSTEGSEAKRCARVEVWPRMSGLTFGDLVEQVREEPDVGKSLVTEWLSCQAAGVALGSVECTEPVAEFLENYWHGMHASVCISSG